MKPIKIGAVGLVAAMALALSSGTALAACTIKIGGLAPLSAPGAVGGGEGMRAAMLIAEEDINDAGGILGCDLKVVIADTEGLPEKASAIMEKLITQDGVVAVGGGYHSSVGVASKDVANNRKIPVVFAETWNDTITGDKQKYIFRIAPLSSWASATLWRAALLVPNIKKVAILTENTDYGIPAAQETSKGLMSGGIEAVTFQRRYRHPGLRRHRRAHEGRKARLHHRVGDRRSGLQLHPAGGRRRHGASGHSVPGRSGVAREQGLLGERPRRQLRFCAAYWHAGEFVEREGAGPERKI